MVFLKSSDIELRAVEPSDADFLTEVENDTTQWQLNGIMAPVSKEFMTIYASTYEPDPLKTCQCRMVAQLRKSKTPIGVCDIFDIDWRNSFGKTGIYIKKQFRGKGYAEQSLNLLKDYAFDVLGLNSLIANVAVKNKDSVRLFFKCGFRHVGDLRQHLRVGREFADISVFESLSSQRDPLPF